MATYLKHRYNTNPGQFDPKYVSLYDGGNEGDGPNNGYPSNWSLQQMTSNCQTKCDSHEYCKGFVIQTTNNDDGYIDNSCNLAVINPNVPYGTPPAMNHLVRFIPGQIQYQAGPTYVKSYRIGPVMPGPWWPSYARSIVGHSV
jgi:hypothetical protein